jgi:hypothetical protein
MDATPFKMIVPFLLSRMEKRGERVRLRINARQVWTFMQVAIDAR